MQNKCSICGKHRYHGGDKKLAAAHSKMAQEKFAEEKAKLEALNGAPAEIKAVVMPFKSMFNKTHARILL